MTANNAQMTATTEISLNKSGIEKTSGKSRIRAFDFARGIAIIAMVMIHTIVFLGNPELVKSLSGYIANSIICLLAAPVFTFIMGVMIVFSSKSSTRTLLLRGCIILGIGYLLNLLRGTLPMAVGEWAEWIDYQDERPWTYMLEEDILQFAGFSFIIIALLRRMIPWNLGLVISGGAIMLSAPLLWKIYLGETIPGYLVSLLFGGNHYNFFPVVPWIAFPLIGIGYGGWLKMSKDRSSFFKKSMIAGVLLCIIGTVIVFFFDHAIIDQWLNGKFRQGKLPPVVSVLFTGFQFIWIPVSYFITEKVKRSKVFDILYHWSSNVTWFYVIQWVVIGWACVLLPYLSWIQVMIAVILIIIITDRIMLSFVKKQRKQ
jgi:uncharacterized membrane protein